ncbi:tetratricopeptide repeat protein [Mucilaginibacter dorajii]|uniref:Tetratricopeptide repeat protein n=1 Tax=Mucilaginibacter dorajii TaxID=692994 RepID=A0ABP7Q0W3_9SPHI|nr:tetratricopeptide repeat protein [Mucilaginibacter dorajii]MCS3732899.1 tetratricopeptide (TPR) repeat protein [Mucilaginibacter dorajii]
MKLFKNVGLIILVLLLSIRVYAQDTDVPGLIKQGIELNNKQDNAGAIEKYKQALAIDAENAQANYQMGFTLNALHKGLEGLPYLDKVTKTKTNFTAAAYVLMGFIYDDNHQYPQAIDAYKQAIALQSARPDAWFSLGLVYFRTKQFAEAEQAAIESIKLDPKNANSQRLYGLVTFHQNKRAAALMGLCSYLLLEPEGPRSDEAYTNMQSILKGGTLKTEDARAEVSTIALNRSLNAAIAKAKPGSTPAEVLQNQLQAIFEAVGSLTEKQTGNDFFRHYYADFFYRLSKTDNMAAFSHLMGLSANKEVGKQWLQQNEDKRKALDSWLEGVKRKF